MDLEIPAAAQITRCSPFFSIFYATRTDCSIIFGQTFRFPTGPAFPDALLLTSLRLTRQSIYFKVKNGSFEI